jgi:hypothetical protein
MFVSASSFRLRYAPARQVADSYHLGPAVTLRQGYGRQASRGMTTVGANTIRPYVDTIELYPLHLSSRG